MSVGLLVVRFQYGLYIVVHLSKFVFLFSVFTRSMSVVSCRYTLAANGLRAGGRSPVLRPRQGYGACTLLAEVNSPLIKSTLLSMLGASILMLVFPSLFSFLRYSDIEKKVTFLNVGELHETSKSASILPLSVSFAC